MAIVKRNILKSWFETGDKPTEPQFSSLIDSLSHANDIDLTVNFIDLETFTLSYNEAFKIDSIIVGGGMTVTVKIAGTSTDYVLGDTVTAGNGLDISVDVVGIINLKGELI